MSPEEEEAMGGSDDDALGLGDASDNASGGDDALQQNQQVMTAVVEMKALTTY